LKISVFSGCQPEEEDLAIFGRLIAIRRKIIFLRPRFTD
jgi:hypothetical protein